MPILLQLQNVNYYLAYIKKRKKILYIFFYKSCIFHIRSKIIKDITFLNNNISLNYDTLIYYIIIIYDIFSIF